MTATKDLIEQICRVILEIRRKPYPVSDIVPLLIKSKDEIERLTAELAELREQKPVAKLVVRMETHDMGQSLAPNPPFKFARVRANASAEELPLGEYPLYARPIPAAQAVPEGWQLVPKAPTPEMLHALTQKAAQGYVAEGYRATLAAAPQPPVQFPAVSFVVPQKIGTDAVIDLARRFNLRAPSHLANGPLPGEWIDRLKGFADAAIDAAMKKGDQPVAKKSGSINDRFLCLLCKSGREGHHGKLDDGVTPCPNGQKGGA